MSTYYDKKKLYKDNDDLYISQYDKALPTASLNGIIDAKKSYNKAKKEGNAAQMKAANDKANEIRKQSGFYTGGKDGSEYNPVSVGFDTQKNKKYTSPYESRKKATLNLMSDKREFSYDPASDPLFEVYKKIYQKLGDDAYERALWENSLRTDGKISTSAQSAASQAKNKYNSALAAKIPELYRASYDTYLSEYERLYDELKLLSDLDDSSYKRYRDSVSDFQKDRQYYADRQKEYLDNLNEIYKFDTSIEYDTIKDANDMAYKIQSNAQKNQTDAVKNAINLAKIIYGKPYVSASFADELIKLIGA